MVVHRRAPPLMTCRDLSGHVQGLDGYHVRSCGLPGGELGPWVDK